MYCPFTSTVFFTGPGESRGFAFGNAPMSAVALYVLPVEPQTVPVEPPKKSRPWAAEWKTEIGAYARGKVMAGRHAFLQDSILECRSHVVLKEK